MAKAEIVLGESGGSDHLPTEGAFYSIGSWAKNTSVSIPVTKKPKALIVFGQASGSSLFYYFSATDSSHALYSATNATTALTVDVASTFGDSSVVLNRIGVTDYTNAYAFIIYD